MCTLVFGVQCSDFAMHINIRELSATGSKYYDHKTLWFLFQQELTAQRDGKLNQDLKSGTIFGAGSKW